MNAHVVLAVFRRNFISYFNNPTGYAFICLFVMLSSLAAFWPDDFFVANLANLDQLNKYLPFIMLVFIPAITMSIWADERRQGTDELLLTIPATDFDVVFGKYLAAVSIFSVSLLFSMACNYMVLLSLGNPDGGLFVATYIGHWLVGLAMLAIGMVASFLTGNLTVGFLLGAIFNVPLVALQWSHLMFSGDWAASLARWSVAGQFLDFGHGVISLASLVYFLSISAAMLYLSVVLISRRHWGGERGAEQGLHYSLREVSLVVFAIGLVSLADLSGVRYDISAGKISSLSKQTSDLLAKLDAKHPVLIEAFISPQVPSSYVQTRLNLLSSLREIEARGHGRIKLEVRSTELNSDEATRAEKLYGIRPRRVQVREGGAYQEEELFLAVAFMSGANKPVVVPFIDTGTPVEYELARSVMTVGRSSRRKVAVLRTDAQIFAGFDQSTFTPTQNSALIEELQKQYDVEQLSPEDLNNPAKKYDCLIAVQPSTLAPPQMEMFVSAVRRGVPTAVFEDPMPATMNVTGTGQPKRPQGQMAMFGQPPQPKGDIGKLWTLLMIDLPADQIVWQNYNPHPRLRNVLPPEFVFLDPDCSATAVFNPHDAITSGLQEVVLMYPGWLSANTGGALKHEQLLMTGTATGYVSYSQLIQQSPFGGGGGINPNPRRQPTGNNYCLALHITGTPGIEPASTEKDKPEPSSNNPALNVVVVSDVDLFSQDFFALRNSGNNTSRPEIDFQFDNVTFVLNIVDVLAGDESIVEIRKRRPQHRTLEQLDDVTEASRREKEKATETLVKNYESEVALAQGEFEGSIKKFQDKISADPSKATAAMQEWQLMRERMQRELDSKLAKMKVDYEKEKSKAQRVYDVEVKRVQKQYKLLAVCLPPLFPLIAGLAVWVNRRASEREGVSRRRLR